jgi:hypothetical protein
MPKYRAAKSSVKDTITDIVNIAFNIDGDSSEEEQRRALTGLIKLCKDALATLDEGEDEDNEDEKPAKKTKRGDSPDTDRGTGVTGKASAIANLIDRQMGGPTALPTVSASRGLSPLTPDEARAHLARLTKNTGGR